MNEDLIDQKLKKKQDDSEDSECIDKMISAEDELATKITQSNIGASSSEDGITSITTKIKNQIDKNITEVEGKVTDIDIEKRERRDDKIYIHVEYDKGTFKESFKIPDSSGKITKQRYPIIRLLEYKNIKDGRFLDLRNKNVPINSEDKEIIVPENTDKRISNWFFDIFQNSRKYNLVRKTRKVRGDRYVTTPLGNYVAGLILSPSMLVIGYGIGTLGTLLVPFPMSSILVIPMMFLAVILTLVGMMGMLLIMFATVAAFLIAMITGILNGLDYLDDEYMPF